MTTKLTNKQFEFVAAYLGKANKNATEAARIAGYAHPLVQGPRLLGNVRIESAIQEWQYEVKTASITEQTHRIAILDDLAKRLVQLVNERAAEMDGEVAGGGTGLLVRQIKPTLASVDKDGTRHYEIDYEYKMDAAVPKELRETLKQAAIEIGEWSENRNVTIKHMDEYIIEVATKYGIDAGELAAELEVGE
jgi:phage terminase small subunit